MDDSYSFSDTSKVSYPSHISLSVDVQSFLTRNPEDDKNKLLTDTFFLLHCEKNSDGTKNLILKGNELQLRIKRRLNDFDVIVLTLLLKKRPEIVHLDLCYNGIGDNGLSILTTYYLSQKNNLRYLNLMYCDISLRGIRDFTNYLVESELTVKDIRLNGNKFGEAGGKLLAKFLNENTFVEYLDIAETDQTLDSINHFMSILHEYHGSNKTIKIIDVSRPILKYNRYQYNSNYLSESIFKMLSCNKTLVELHIQKCQLDGHDAEILVKGLKENDTLLYLDIGLNKIGNHGIEVLARFLKRRPTLLGLNVSANNIKDTGARALSLNMPFSRIRLLDISNNNISDDGITDILNSIKKPVQIRLLYMWGNDLGPQSCARIRRMLKAEVLQQECIDIVVYEVDHVLHPAWLRSDRYKHKYYCELDVGTVTPVVIKENPPPSEDKPRLDLVHYPVISGYLTGPVKEPEPCNSCCVCKK